MLSCVEGRSLRARFDLRVRAYTFTCTAPILMVEALATGITAESGRQCGSASSRWPGTLRRTRFLKNSSGL
jgi:hypothetical protein